MGRDRKWVALAIGLLLCVAAEVWPAKGLAQEAGSPEGRAPTRILKVITVLVTRITPEHGFNLEPFPRRLEILRGDTVLWVNAVPETLAHVVFDDLIPSSGACGLSTGPAPPASGRYVSDPMESGTASFLCFDTPGTYTYRVVISTAAWGSLLTGEVVVR